MDENLARQLAQEKRKKRSFWPPRGVNGCETRARVSTLRTIELIRMGSDGCAISVSRKFLQRR